MATIISFVLTFTPTALVYNRAEAESRRPVPVEQERDKLTVWLDDLAVFESSGNDGAKVLDTNGRYSYGCLQFQMATFTSKAAQYGFEVGDATETIFDCDLQKRIARAMLENEPKAWRNWYTSIAVRGLRMPPITH